MGTADCKRFLGNPYKYEITHNCFLYGRNMEKTKNSYKYSGLDFTGKRHGRLVVIGKAEVGRSWWHCKCDCGRQIDMSTWKFLNYKSCGCLEKENRENLSVYTIRHGMTNSRLYSVWCGIKDRCNNPNVEHYDRYGGRGIKMCDEWQNSFESFRDWAYSVGYRDDLNGKEQSIDRINVDGNYCPENCRWVDQKTQMRNTSSTIYISYQGKDVPLAEFCEMFGISYPHFVKRRMQKGIDADEIIREWNMKHVNHDGYYTMMEAASHYSVSTQSIKIWIDNGYLQAFRLGTTWFIPVGQTVERRDDRDEKGRFLSAEKLQQKIA